MNVGAGLSVARHGADVVHSRRVKTGVAPFGKLLIVDTEFHVEKLLEFVCLNKRVYRKVAHIISSVSIDNVIEYNDSITVSTKNGNAVIISESEYNAMLETIYLVSQKGLVDRIKEGEKEDIASMSTYNPNEEW